MPWKTAGTAGRPCCRADRDELRSPPPPPPRPAPRLHAAEKQQVKIDKIFLLLHICKISNTREKSRLLPSAWDVHAVPCWDHRMMVKRQTPRCQTPRPLEPRPQEPHRWNLPQQPRWKAATPQHQDRWWRLSQPQQPQPPGWRWRPRLPPHRCCNIKEKLIQVQLFEIPIFHGSHRHLNLI